MKEELLEKLPSALLGCIVECHVRGILLEDYQKITLTKDINRTCKNGMQIP